MARRLFLALFALLLIPCRLLAQRSLVVLPDGRRAEVVARFRADSVQELSLQLDAALRGDLDRHDLAVRATLARCRELRKAL